jgi:hypothetical protein
MRSKSYSKNQNMDCNLIVIKKPTLKAGLMKNILDLTTDIIK